MSLDNAAMTVYGDSISGNCLKVKFVADYLGVPYEWVEIDVRSGATHKPGFLAMNPAGQVPVADFAQSGPLAQSNAIMLHLAWDSALVPDDAWERAQMFQWLFWEQYSHEPAIAVLRFQRLYLEKPDSEIDPALAKKSERALRLMNSHLIGRTHLVGTQLSLADIALVAYTRFAHDAGLDLAQWPNVQAWVRRIEDDLKIEHAGE
jgi:glutathione S-transferase